jgi:hypothetical protein
MRKGEEAVKGFKRVEAALEDKKYRRDAEGAGWSTARTGAFRWT